jgi:hypothetical protein
MERVRSRVTAGGGKSKADTGAPTPVAPRTPADFCSDCANSLISPVRLSEQFKYFKVLLFLYDYDFIPQPFAEKGHVQ